jgi:dTDP-4-dehydrorhamnose 3,5-epimerase
MKVNVFNLNKKNYPLIEDVVVYPLKVNRDERGILVESLKTTWNRVFDSQRRPFAQCYYSITDPGVARDIDRWHCHPTNQEDRFVVIKGDIFVALYDWRKKSKTYGTLNLFNMGESQGDDGQYLLLVPVNVLHCFKNIGQKEAILLNFPTQLYNPQEEGRIPFKEVKLSDGTYFNWALVSDL